MTSDTAQRVVTAAEAIGYHATGLLKRRISEIPSRKFGFLLQKRDDYFYQALGAELTAATRASRAIEGRAVLEFVDQLVPSLIAAKLRELGRKADALAVVAVDHPHVSAAIADLQEGGIPIWVSGTVNGPMLRRLARFGVGWIPWGDDALDLPGSIAKVKDGLTKLGRDPEGLGVVGQFGIKKADDGAVDIGATLESVPAMLAAGVTDFRFPLPFGSTVEESVDRITPLVEAFRSAVG